MRGTKVRILPCAPGFKPFSGAKPADEIPSEVEGSQDSELVVTKRLALALVAYVGLAGLAFTTLTDTRIRLATLAILAMFAVKTWVRRGDVMHPGGESGE